MLRWLKWRWCSKLFLLFTFHKMNEREDRLLKLLEQASTALEETQEKRNNAEKVVAEWATLPTTHKEHWDNATLKFKRKTIEEWEQEVEKLEKEVEDAKQREKEARAAFMAVVPQGSFIL